MHDERPVLQQKCPFALQMNEKNPDLQQRQPSLLQNARPNLNICVTYTARPTRHDKRGEDDAEAAAANPGASGFPSPARLVPMQSISRLHPLSDPYMAAFIVISRLKSYAEPRIDVIPAILRQNLLPGPQIAVFLRKTRLKRAVNSRTDLYLPISRLELPSGRRNQRGTNCRPSIVRWMRLLLTGLRQPGICRPRRTLSKNVPIAYQVISALDGECVTISK